MALAELDLGCHGAQVKMLQHLLNTAPRQRPSLQLDGVFGQLTDAKVRDYQGLHSLAVDGVVGHRTWESLGMRPGELPAPAPKGPAVPSAVPTAIR